MRLNRTRAFTLVELLVVIAIIGILVGDALAGRSKRSRSGKAYQLQEPNSPAFYGRPKLPVSELETAPGMEREKLKFRVRVGLEFLPAPVSRTEPGF